MHSHSRSRRIQDPKGQSRRLLAATLLNLVITLVEVAGSILSGSIALLSDAVHNLGDTLATFVAFLASRISRKEASTRRTFGFRRVEILSALFNSVVLLVTCIFLIRAAVERFLEPSAVDSLVMMVVGMIGLLANLYALIILRRDAGHNLNVRAAYLHLLGDVFSSVLVVTGGILIRYLELPWIDPLVTVVISLYIIREAFAVVKETVNILMQSAPESLDLEKVRQRIESLAPVKNFHHVHAWMLTDQTLHLEAHVEFHQDLKLSETGESGRQIEKILKEEFGVSHITLQFEYRSMHDPRLIRKEQ